MLNDIKREKRLRDRLEELKKLSLSDTGSYISSGMFENKEALFGLFGRSKNVKRESESQLTVSVLEDDDRLVDLKQYIVVHAWMEHDLLNLHHYEWRYYRHDGDIHYIRDGIDMGKGLHPQRDTAVNKYNEMRGEYIVTEQKVKFDGFVRIEEVRQYDDGTQKLWRFQHKEWKDVTPTVV